MSHATRRALMSLMMSADTQDALDEISRQLSGIDFTDLSVDLGLDQLDLDLDDLDARSIEPAFLFDNDVTECLDGPNDLYER